MQMSPSSALLVTLLLASPLDARSAGPEGEIHSAAEIFVLDPLPTDARTFSAQDVIEQADVRLEVRNQTLAARFNAVLREGMACTDAPRPTRSEYKAVVRFRNSDQYLISIKSVETADFRCRRDLDIRLRDMLFHLLLVNDPTARFPELSRPKPPTQ